MSQEAVNPLEAFTPFASDETARLERYAARTRKLFECSFIQRAETTWTLTGGTGRAVTSSIAGAGADEDELHEALMLLRPLHLQNEKAGFAQIQAMTKRHAHEKGTPESKRALVAIKSYTAALKHILRNPDLIQLREERLDDTGEVDAQEVSPERVFDDFLYGIYFHEDEERISRIGDWLPAEVQRFIFLGTVKRVAQVYTGFAGTPVAILREPALRTP
jgi:hypothetical protein